MVTIPIGIQPGTKALRVERVEHSHWILWISTKDFKTGTYLEFHDDGHINRVTIFPDGMEDILEVKPREVRQIGWRTKEFRNFHVRVHPEMRPMFSKDRGITWKDIIPGNASDFGALLGNDINEYCKTATQKIKFTKSP